MPLAVSVSCDWKITSQVRTGDPFSRPQIPVHSYSQTAFLTCCKVVQEEEKTCSEPTVHESLTRLCSHKRQKLIKNQSWWWHEHLKVWKCHRNFELALDRDSQDVGLSTAIYFLPNLSLSVVAVLPVYHLKQQNCSPIDTAQPNWAVVMTAMHEVGGLQAKRTKRAPNSTITNASVKGERLHCEHCVLPWHLWTWLYRNKNVHRNKMIADRWRWNWFWMPENCWLGHYETKYVKTILHDISSLSDLLAWVLSDFIKVSS